MDVQFKYSFAHQSSVRITILDYKHPEHIFHARFDQIAQWSYIAIFVSTSFLIHFQMLQISWGPPPI